MDVERIEQLAKDFVQVVEKRSDDWQYCDRQVQVRTFVADVVGLAEASNLKAMLEHIDSEIRYALSEMEVVPAYDDAERAYWKGFKEGLETFKSWVKVHSRKEVDDEETRHGKS